MPGFAAGMVPHSDIIAISGVGWPAVNYTIAVITAGWGWKQSSQNPLSGIERQILINGTGGI